MAQGQAASVLGQPQQALFRFPDFTAGKWISDVRSVVATHRVAKGNLIQFYADRPFRLYLMARADDKTFTGSSSDVDVAFTDIPIVTSTRPKPTLPADDYPDAVAYYTKDNTASPVVWTLCNVKSISGTTVTVTVPGDTSSASHPAARLYYLPGNGHVAIRANAPAGSDTVSRELYNNTLRALHETDQASGVTAPLLGHGMQQKAFGLPQDWQIAIEVVTTDPIYWESSARTELSLRAQTFKILVHNPTMLNSIANRSLRGG